MHLVILLEVDVGKHLSCGLFLVGPAAPGKHRWTAAIPNVVSVQEAGT